jgi:putative addiction module component (TIGR02574 family)
MTSKAQRILEEGLTLRPEERADVAANLMESLDDSVDEDVEQAWADELKRRIQEVESGAVETVPWSEARRRMLALRDARKDL